MEVGDDDDILARAGGLRVMGGRAPVFRLDAPSLPPRTPREFPWLEGQNEGIGKGGGEPTREGVRKVVVGEASA